jgi:hypothetical protein
VIEGAITPERVKAAAAKAEVSIRPGIYYNPEACAACPLAALYLAEHPEAIGKDLDIEDPVEIAYLLELDEDLTAGFMDGFDGHQDRHVYLGVSGPEEYRRGYAEGLACRVALLPAGEVAP